MSVGLPQVQPVASPGCGRGRGLVAGDQREPERASGLDVRRVDARGGPVVGAEVVGLDGLAVVVQGRVPVARACRPACRRWCRCRAGSRRWTGVESRPRRRSRGDVRHAGHVRVDDRVVGRRVAVLAVDDELADPALGARCAGGHGAGGRRCRRPARAARWWGARADRAAEGPGSRAAASPPPRPPPSRWRSRRPRGRAVRCFRLSCWASPAP